MCNPCVKIKRTPQYAYISYIPEAPPDSRRAAGTGARARFCAIYVRSYHFIALSLARSWCPRARTLTVDKLSTSASWAPVAAVRGRPVLWPVAVDVTIWV